MAKIVVDGSRKNYVTIIVNNKDSITFEEENQSVTKPGTAWTPGSTIIYNDNFQVIKGEL